MYNKLCKIGKDKDMKQEKYRSLESLEYAIVQNTDGFTHALPENLVKKLAYYAAAAEDPMNGLDATEAVKDLIKSEGKNPADYQDLLSALQEYDVVYPNMFLTESIDKDYLQTEFKPKGPAAARISKLAAETLTALTESRLKIHDPEETGLDPEKLKDYIYEYMQSALAGPFASIVDLGERKPLLVLNDMSYTAAQTFRAFSGVYCDMTPIPHLSKADFLAFSVFHEIGHKRTEEIIADGTANTYIPGIELDINPDAMAHKNLVESIADAFATLKHIQRTGSAALPQQVAIMRALSPFSNTFQRFETGFSLFVGGSSRQRSISEYYTTPVIDQTIQQALDLYEQNTLQNMSDAELTKIAIEVAKAHKPSAATLNLLSTFATSLTFNAIRYYPDSSIPLYKNSLSPAIVVHCLKEMEKHGRFKPKGGNSLEAIFYKAADPGQKTDSLFHADGIEISSELKTIFQRYYRAIEELNQTSIRPFTDEANQHLIEDITSTLNLVANQTPNMTLAREVNDSYASEGKYAGMDGHLFNLVGVRLMLENAGLSTSDASFDFSRTYIRATDDKPQTSDLILQMMKNTAHPPAPAAIKAPPPAVK